MGRQYKCIEKEAPFISIEADAELLGLEVKHEGMSKEAALALVQDIDNLGLDLDASEVVIPGTGRKRYEREPKRRPALASERYYTIIDARYHVQVTHEDKTLLLENRAQWELYKRLYLADRSITVRIKTGDYDDISRRFEERTGIALDNFLQTDETEETEELDTPEKEPTELELLELSLEEYETSPIG